MNKEPTENSFGLFNEINLKIRDIEQKQLALNERVLLIGKNLISIKEEQIEEKIELRKEIENLKEIITKMGKVIENLTDEFPKLARRKDLEILEKQAIMFKPLEFIKNK